MFSKMIVFISIPLTLTFASPASGGLNNKCPTQLHDLKFSSVAPPEDLYPSLILEDGRVATCNSKQDTFGEQQGAFHIRKVQGAPSTKQPWDLHFELLYLRCLQKTKSAEQYQFQAANPYNPFVLGFPGVTETAMANVIRVDVVLKSEATDEVISRKKISANGIQPIHFQVPSQFNAKDLNIYFVQTLMVDCEIYQVWFGGYRLNSAQIIL